MTSDAVSGGRKAKAPRSLRTSVVKSSSARPLLLGHRGARRLPRIGLRSPGMLAENTFAAFEYALAQGCDGFEFDVRFTADRRSAIWHDPKFEGREIASTEYSALERRSVPVPCLEDVLARFASRSYLDIELKVGGQEEAIVDAIRAHPPMNGFVVSSFLPEVLQRLHELDSSLPLGYVSKQVSSAKLWRELPISVFIPHYKLVSQVVVDEVHAAGKKVFTWTVNRRRDLLRLARWGVDGLISDDPKLLHETFLRSS